MFSYEHCDNRHIAEVFFCKWFTIYGISNVKQYGYDI